MALKNYNFYKVFFAIVALFFSSASFSDQLDTINDNIVSADQLINLYNSNNDDLSVSVSKQSIQGFIIKEPYYILLDKLLLGSLTDSLNFIGLDVPHPSSSLYDSDAKHDTYLFVYVIQAAWFVSAFILIFIIGKIAFKTLFEGASSGEL